MEGVWTTGELLSGGLTAGRIRRMVRDGALCSLRPGVYASAGAVSALVGDTRDEWERRAGTQLLRVAATLAVTGSRSAGSHRSAALAYGLGLAGRGPDSVAEITRAPGGKVAARAASGCWCTSRRCPRSMWSAAVVSG